MYSKRLLAVLCLQTISALAIIVIASGWGDGKKATYPVTGKVVAGAGKTPAKGAIVMLIPVTFDIKDLERSMATVDDDGAFAITTYNANDGAPAGEYVTLQYQTSFEKMPTAAEIVHFMLAPDGTWRAVGYVIK